MSPHPLSCPQNAFVQLSLAFRNDNYTLEMRLKQAERERNLTEEDTEKELEEFKGSLKVRTESDASRMWLVANCDLSVEPRLSESSLHRFVQSEWDDFAVPARRCPPPTGRTWNSARPTSASSRRCLCCGGWPRASPAERRSSERFDRCAGREHACEGAGAGAGAGP